MFENVYLKYRFSDIKIGFGAGKTTFFPDWFWLLSFSRTILIERNFYNMSVTSNSF